MLWAVEAVWGNGRNLDVERVAAGNCSGERLRDMFAAPVVTSVAPLLMTDGDVSEVDLLGLHFQDARATPNARMGRMGCKSEEG